jgi:hypothetical protein
MPAYSGGREATQKRYYEANKDEILVRGKEQYHLNIEIERDRCRKYRETNKELIKQRRTIRARELRKTDELFKLNANVSRMVRHMFQHIGASKNGRWNKLLSYSVDELKQHLETQFDSWMNWNNYGKYEKKTWIDTDPSTWVWQIDHLSPRSLCKTAEEIIMCWRLSNLRPYSAKQNMIDGVTRVRHGVTNAV